MRIAIFTNNYLPNPYGVTGSIESFRKEFEKRGHTVYIFAPKFPGYSDKSPNVFRYSSFNVTSNGIKYPLGISISQRVDKIIKNLKFDIIHSQHPNLLGNAAKKWAKKKNIPLVFTWHTLYDHYAHFFAKVIPEKIAAWYIIRKAVNFANCSDAVVVPTDSIISILKNWGVKNKNIIPIATGVEEDNFSNADRMAMRKKYNIAGDDTVLLLVSRLTSEKNVEFVFRSVGEILRNNKKVKLLIVGGGYLNTRLEQFCAAQNFSDQAIFSGEVSRSEMKNYYAAANIFVYGSKSETQGMIITEAMYMGLPVVAVNATGINSLVLNNGNGFLVKENELEFSRAVQKLLDDKNLRQKFGETSKRIARTQFTASVCAEKMLRVYEGAIKNRATVKPPRP